MKRFAALVAAVLIVAGALALRQARDEQADGPVDAPRGIICADDLADACRGAGLEVTSAPAGETADGLTAPGSELGARAWVTTAAWAELVVAERAFARLEPAFEIDGRPIASSPIVISVWGEAAEALGCPSPAWTCLAERVGSDLPGGNRLIVGSPPIESATGLVVAASQAADLLGSADYSANDFDLDDRFRRLGPGLTERRLERPLAFMRLRGPGELTAAGTTAADARTTNSTFGPIATVEPEILVRADVVVVVPAGGGLDEDERAALADALGTVGWQAPSDGSDGLPGGAVLAALRSLWADDR